MTNMTHKSSTSKNAFRGRSKSAKAAMLIAKARAYQDRADADSTVKAYKADYTQFGAWCREHGFRAMPRAPWTVGAYLAAAGEGFAMSTLRRRVAAIAKALRMAGHALDTKHPAIRRAIAFGSAASA
jgi:hypothetical protein